jgi:hypothetical protein
LSPRRRKRRRPMPSCPHLALSAQPTPSSPLLEAAHRDLALGPGQGERGGGPPSTLSLRTAAASAGSRPLLASMELPGVALCCGAATATGGEEMLRMGSSDAARRRRKTSGAGARRRRTDSGAAAERRLTSLTARCSYQWPCLVPLEREEEDKGCSVGRMNSARLVE